MSSEIYYDRAFIRVGHDYIPMVNHGSSNCFELSFNGREIPEKHWSVLNYRSRARPVFTPDEIKAIAADYERISTESGGGIRRTRNTAFMPGEFERWILCGMKSAYTIEEYVSFGNILQMNGYETDENGRWKLYRFTTTEEFLRLQSEHKDSKELNVLFSDNRTVCRPKKMINRAPQKPTGDTCFVLRDDTYTDYAIYLCRLTKAKIYYCPHLDSGAVKKFPSEAKADKWLAKYRHRIPSAYAFAPTKHTILPLTDLVKCGA